MSPDMDIQEHTRDHALRLASRGSRDTSIITHPSARRLRTGQRASRPFHYGLQAIQTASDQETAQLIRL
jgi:hypothetical protein